MVHLILTLSNTFLFSLIHLLFLNFLPLLLFVYFPSLFSEIGMLTIDGLTLSCHKVSPVKPLAGCTWPKVHLLSLGSFYVATEHFALSYLAPLLSRGVQLVKMLSDSIPRSTRHLLQGIMR